MPILLLVALVACLLLCTQGYWFLKHRKGLMSKLYSTTTLLEKVLNQHLRPIRMVVTAAALQGGWELLWSMR